MPDTRCWYVQCSTTIPTVTRYAPFGDGSQFVEQQVADPRKMLDHLAEAHPTETRVHYTERRTYG